MNLSDEIVVGEDQWKKLYLEMENDCDRKTWVKCTLSNGSVIFLLEDAGMSKIKKYCVANNLHIIKAGLRFRSNDVEIDTQNAEAVYIVSSMRGSMGSDNLYCITIGYLEDDIVYKTAYVTPELIELFKDEDKIEDCFEEALIYNDDKKKTKDK